MVTKIIYVFLIFPRGKAMHLGQGNNLILYPSFTALRELWHHMAKVTEWELPRLSSVIDWSLPVRWSKCFTFLNSRNHSLFLGAGWNRELGFGWTAELGHKVLRTDSLVWWAVSINLEKDEQGNIRLRQGCPEKYNILPAIPWRHTLTSISSHNRLQLSKALSWNLFTYMCRSSPECFRVQPSSARENLASL